MSGQPHVEFLPSTTPGSALTVSQAAGPPTRGHRRVRPEARHECNTTITKDRPEVTDPLPRPEHDRYDPVRKSTPVPGPDAGLIHCEGKSRAAIRLDGRLSEDFDLGIVGRDSQVGPIELLQLGILGIGPDLDCPAAAQTIRRVGRRARGHWAARLMAFLIAKA